MILAISTSSPVASVALILKSGEILFSESRLSRQQASAVTMEMIESALRAGSTTLSQISLFAADTGPGSFTGVRVGIVLAKTLAFVHGAQCIGADAFDLVSKDQTVVMPSKKGEFFVRRIGEEPYRTKDLPTGEDFKGFGFPGGEDYPLASGFSRLLAQCEPETPEAFAPMYLIEPSISLPKRPFSA